MFVVDMCANVLLLPFMCRLQVDLGASALSKRPTSCILITPGKSGFNALDAYEELLEDVKQVQPVY